MPYAHEIYFEDHGSGRPIVLIHGFPQDGTSWEKQVGPLLDAGHRVITYDRRGFGRSGRPATGYDYDTFAADLDALMTQLDLTDAVLVGFSMGTGDVARYLSRYGSARVTRAVMIATLGPQFAWSEDDPIGFPPEVFAGIAEQIRTDRFAYLERYFQTHFVTATNLGVRISEQALRANFANAATASALATLHCVDAWQEDFRSDLPKIDVPLLVLHGTADQNIPIDFGARRIRQFVPSAEIIEVEDGPHGIAWTHPEIVNPALLAFIAAA
ncbi:alpha/beta hydrolase [Actinoplanes bogorensis]|uniref:Alpha/beta hydrolase n=1 Tax=Paractinoplanes bogorensis TaxID=1610840 RepID=A0ABS5YI56_9ACTN|nr:alpha/beta hydrolase [Actinoplanes bogorensis]MBU2662404.1 alpha/beta hydrolase [Actinoplanes bogorensis]